MASTFTTNKGIEKPASGDYVNAWAAPLNADWDDVDSALGGTTSISVTGVGAGIIALTVTQYRPPNIEFSGTLSANLQYQIPAGVGGIWTISNATNGSNTLQFSIASGNALTLGSGRTLIVSDGTNVSIAANYAPLQTGTFTATLTGGSGGGTTATVVFNYNIIGNMAFVWKTNTLNLITVVTGSLGTLQITGFPAVVTPPSNPQVTQYALVYINGSYYEAATAIDTTGIVTFATLGLTSGKLQRSNFGFGANVSAGIEYLILSYPLV